MAVHRFDLVKIGKKDQDATPLGRFALRIINAPAALAPGRFGRVTRNSADAGLDVTARVEGLTAVSAK
jgi:hypothetical protein